MRDSALAGAAAMIPSGAWTQERGLRTVSGRPRMTLRFKPYTLQLKHVFALATRRYVEPPGMARRERPLMPAIVSVYRLTWPPSSISQAECVVAWAILHQTPSTSGRFSKETDMAGGSTASRTADDLVLLVGRVAVGVIFLQNSLGQLAALSGFEANLASRGVPLPFVFAVIGVAVQIICGILVLTGLRTREASLMLVLFMIIATALSHRYWELPEATRRGQELHFFKNVSIVGGLLLLFVGGPGGLSLDALFCRK
jgi:putative oxidoreductase